MEHRELARRPVPPPTAHPTVYALAVEVSADVERVDMLEYRGITAKPRPHLAGVGVLDLAASGDGHTVWARAVGGVLYWMIEPRGTVE